jgi:hypothetical protein
MRSSASYPVVPAHAQPSGSGSSPVRIFSTTVQRPSQASLSRRRYPAGSASPSGWSIRSPSATPSRSSRSSVACVAAKTSGSSTRTAISSEMVKNRR